MKREKTPTRKGLLKGTKVSKNHSTVIPPAYKFLEDLKKEDKINKIVLGEIVSLHSSGGAKTRIKVVDIPAGFRVVIRGTHSQQTFFIYTNDKMGVKDRLDKLLVV